MTGRFTYMPSVSPSAQWKCEHLSVGMLRNKYSQTQRNGRKLPWRIHSKLMLLPGSPSKYHFVELHSLPLIQVCSLINEILSSFNVSLVQNIIGKYLLPSPLFPSAGAMLAPRSSVPACHGSDRPLQPQISPFWVSFCLDLSR